MFTAHKQFGARQGGSLYDVTSCLAVWSRSHVPSRGVCVSGPMFLPGGHLCPEGLSAGKSLSRGSLSGGSLSGVSVKEGLCQGEGGLCPGGICQGDPWMWQVGRTHPTGMLSCFNYLHTRHTDLSLICIFRGI